MKMILCSCAYGYFTSVEDTSGPVLFTEMISINYANVIKKFVAFFGENRYFVSEARLKFPYFWSCNVHIHRSPTHAGYTLKYSYANMNKTRLVIQALAKGMYFTYVYADIERRTTFQKPIICVKGGD
jgi:hypothetical protein